MSAAGVNVTSLAYVSMYVNDLSASRRFFAELLGLDVVEEDDWGIIVRKGEVGLVLHERKGRPVQHLELTFDVDDVDGAIEALRRRNVSVLDEPSDRAWGDRDGAVADPDGNVVYLRSTGARTR
jgi:catechol 2,3-dioxygenase-like lactoylglutathione lyase family enzyme